MYSDFGFFNYFLIPENAGLNRTGHVSVECKNFTLVCAQERHWWALDIHTAICISVFHNIGIIVKTNKQCVEKCLVIDVLFYYLHSQGLQDRGESRGETKERELNRSEEGGWREQKVFITEFIVCIVPFTDNQPPFIVTDQHGGVNKVEGESYGFLAGI